MILVHGLWMHGAVFFLLRRRLARAGFDVRTWSYPSVRGGLAANVDALARFVAGLDADVIDLVGHSLGGVIALVMRARHADARIGRIVLMGAPWRGSYSAERLLRVRGLRALVGRSMRDWMASSPPRVPDGPELGVIAGSRGIGVIGTLVRLPAPNDGVVMVEETRLEQARDAITLPVNHAEMLFSRSCAEQVEAFLRAGAFAPHARASGGTA